jgi:hypothetical protein
VRAVRCRNGRLAALTIALCASLLLCGCATIHRWMNRPARVGCSAAPFNGNADTRPPLKVPEGLSAPDTTGAVKIPALNEPDRPRPRSASCLDIPPSYGSEPTGLPPRRPLNQIR